LILKGDQKNIKYMICNKIPLSLYTKIQDLSVTNQKYASIIIESFNKKNDGFKLKDASSVIGLSENQTNKLLKKMINCGAVVSEGNTVSRNYSINNK
jgi:Fic family protein